jgi:hypothetical protein
MKTSWLSPKTLAVSPELIKRALPGILVAAGAAVFAVLTSDSATHASHRGTKEARTAKAAAEMAKAADAFLAVLTPEQRTKAVFPFTSEEREDWYFVPRARKGIPLKELTPQQRGKAESLIKSALSAKGWDTMQTIVSLEHVLHHAENKNPGRDTGLYYITIFGKPGTGAEPWGWRVEGHHLSFNFTLAGGGVVATTPMFWGANPAEVRTEVPDNPLAPKKGTRSLAAREEAGRKLLLLLTSEQRKTAMLTEKAYSDIQTGNRKQIDPLTPEGVSVAAFTAEQKRVLNDLLNAYLSVMVSPVEKERRERIQKTGLDKLHFAWAGSAEPGQGHYYRVQGPTFLLEYDNTQNGANHIHSVWRDFKGDFGRDILAEHRTAAHAGNERDSERAGE